VAGGLLAADEQLTGEVLGVIYADPDSGFGVVELGPSDGTAGERCSGPLSDLVEGQHIQLVGAWRDHPRYGRTFEAVYYEQVAPSTVAGLRSFLGSERFAEVSDRGRQRVLVTFGSGAGRIIEHEPERLVAEAGLEADDADRLHRAWMSGQALGELVRLVEPAGWPMDAVRSAHGRFGADAARLGREDPYALLDADRVRFAHADALARKLGISASDPRRLAAGARAAVAAARRRDGHQHLPRRECVEAAGSLLKVDAILAASGVDDAVASGSLATDEVAGEPVVSTPAAFDAERDLAAGIVRLLTASPTRVTPHADAVDPSDDLTTGQAAAVRAAFTHPVTVLTGGPGTGKTRTVQEVVRDRRGGGPRGRALRPDGAGSEAHRGARRSPGDHDPSPARGTPDRWGRVRVPVRGARTAAAGPRRGRRGVDVRHVARRPVGRRGRHRVRTSSSSGTRTSSPPSGRGTCSAMCCVRAWCPRPSSSRSTGRPPTAASSGSLGSDAHRGARPAPGRRRRPLRRRGAPPDRDRPAGRPGRRRTRAVVLRVEVDEVQVLAPVYRGPVGVDALNVALKEALNPPAGRHSVAGFHEGDRVMQTRNDPELDVANGDVGHVVDLSKRGGTLRVAYPRGEVTYDRDQAKDLVPAWAVTVHKSQGGEWPVVVLVCDRSHRAMLWRNLVYTAITRAQRALIVIGQTEALAAAARHDRPSDRRTGLAWRLRQLVDRDDGPAPDA
jgi:exodeoxyribonuclease V alpha subunit